MLPKIRSSCNSIAYSHKKFLEYHGHVHGETLRASARMPDAIAGQHAAANDSQVVATEHNAPIAADDLSNAVAGHDREFCCVCLASNLNLRWGCGHNTCSACCTRVKKMMRIVSQDKHYPLLTYFRYQNEVAPSVGILWSFEPEILYQCPLCHEFSTCSFTESRYTRSHQIKAGADSCDTTLRSIY